MDSGNKSGATLAVTSWSTSGKEVMEKNKVVTIGTCGGDGPHLVATWEDHMRVIGIKDGEVIIVPAGGYHRTEENLRFL